MTEERPKSRKVHITRIFGTNKKKEILTDIWADVERIDKARYRQKVDGVRTYVEKKLRWRDDPKDEAEYLDLDDTDPSDDRLTRKYVIVKVCDPESTDDLNEPEEWIPIRRIKSIKTRKKSKKMNTRQKAQQRMIENINMDLKNSRVVKARRFYHYDTNIDDEVQKAVDEDPKLKQYVVKSSRYKKKDGTDGEEDTKDKDQYVEHEVITKIVHRGNDVYYNDDPTLTSNNKRQIKKTKFLNDFLIEQSDEAKLEKMGEGDKNPPYRFDPYQNIININFGGIAVEFGDKDQDPPKDDE